MAPCAIHVSLQSPRTDYYLCLYIIEIGLNFNTTKLTCIVLTHKNDKLWIHEPFFLFADWLYHIYKVIFASDKSDNNDMLKLIRMLKIEQIS